MEAPFSSSAGDLCVVAITELEFIATGKFDLFRRYPACRMISGSAVGLLSVFCEESRCVRIW